MSYDKLLRKVESEEWVIFKTIKVWDFNIVLKTGSIFIKNNGYFIKSLCLVFGLFCNAFNLLFNVQSLFLAYCKKNNINNTITFGESLQHNKII